MISFALEHISWGMVVVAAFVGWIIGMLWYSPLLFGNSWLRASGITLDPNASMIPYLANEFVGLLVQSYALALVLEGMDALAFVDAVTVAAIISLLFIGVNQWAGVVWSRRPYELFFIYQGGTLIAFCAMAMLFAYVAS